LKGTLKII